MSKLTWFRLHSEMPNDPKIKLLAFEDRWHYVSLLCFKCSEELDNANESLKERMIAAHLGLSLSELDSVKKRLSEVYLIDNDWQPLGWDKRQYKSDSSNDRVSKFRKKRYSNVTVTPPETDTETDTEEHIKPIVVKKNIPDCPHQEIINLYLNNLPMCTNPRTWEGKRPGLLRSRWSEKGNRQNVEWWGKFFEYIAKSRFLTGNIETPGRRTFKADLPWILKKDNFDKIIDGSYHE